MAGALFLFGPTCAGKSSVGKALENLLGWPYISMGDLKRDHIASGTAIGKAVLALHASGSRFPPELGYDIVGPKIGDGVCVMSGYPISPAELEIMSQNCEPIGIAVLCVDESTLLQRFARRRVCPVCHEPGTEGDSCTVHSVALIPRPDSNGTELRARQALFRHTILPFLASQAAALLPRLDVAASSATPVQIAETLAQWAQGLLRTKERTTCS